MTISNNPKPPAGALSGEGEVIIIAGDYYEYGTDANEVIISDAVRSNLTGGKIEKIVL